MSAANVRRIAVLACMLALAGCASSPIGVKRMDPDAVSRALTAKLASTEGWRFDGNPYDINALGHPGFGMLLHFRGTEGDALMAPWAMHTHISWEITSTCLEEKMNMLRAAGYQGYWSVEHHTGKNEYSEVAVQVAQVRAQLAR